VSRFVAQFIGSTNFLPGEAREAASVGGFCIVTTEAGDMRLLAPQALRPGEPVQIAVRPERLRFGSGTVSGALNLTGTVLRHVYLGNHTETHVRTGAGSLCIVQTGNDGSARLPAVDEEVRLAASSGDCRVFRAGS
jgi:ABC-type Fe3+/spermidine/putrescine transport system ATPase subunit